MAWNDPATDKQISALYEMMNWKVPANQNYKALCWLTVNRPTRKAISIEIDRVFKICVEHKNGDMSWCCNDGWRKFFLVGDFWNGLEKWPDDPSFEIKNWKGVTTWIAEHKNFGC